MPRRRIRRAYECRRPRVFSTSRLLEGPFRALAHLGALTQIMVGDHARHHGLADRHRTNADARIVASLGADLGLVAEAIDGAAWRQDRGGRLDGKTCNDRLTGRDPAQDAARIVAQEHRLAVVTHANLVPVLLAGKGSGGKTRADLDAF